jgi:hypothetical protein
MVHHCDGMPSWVGDSTASDLTSGTKRMALAPRMALAFSMNCRSEPWIGCSSEGESPMTVTALKLKAKSSAPESPTTTRATCSERESMEASSEPVVRPPKQGPGVERSIPVPESWMHDAPAGP